MNKKLIALVGAGALLLSVAGFAFAVQCPGQDCLPQPVNFCFWCRNRDVARVNNQATAIADTGGNTQNNVAQAGASSEAEVEVEGSSSRSITTGDAHAEAEAVVVANTHVGCCLVLTQGCHPCGFGNLYTDLAEVGNGSLAAAYSGANIQDDVAQATGDSEAEVEVEEGSSSRSIKSGNSWSGATAWTVVNTHLSSWYLVPDFPF